MTRALPLLCLACACVDVPDFSRPSEIDRPRVLAVVSEPPEIHPGESAALSVLVAGTHDHRVRWSACGAFFTMFDGASAQYGDGADDQGCGGAFTVDLGAGDTAVLPGEVSAALFADLDLAAVILGSVLPEGTVETIRSEVGLPILIEATVEVDDRVLRAVKRVLVSERPVTHANPPPPHFRLDGIEIGIDPDTPFGCRGVADPVAIASGGEVELAPIVPKGGEDWLEHYAIIDATGRSSRREERAFYSWFATAGDLSEEVTRAPLRNELWAPGAEPGCRRLWLVVRDGHGGASGCGVDVAVGQARCD